MRDEEQRSKHAAYMRQWQRDHRASLSPEQLEAFRRKEREKVAKWRERWTDEKRRAVQQVEAKANRKRYAYRREHGLCQWCGQPHGGAIGRTCCAACTEKGSVDRKANYDPAKARARHLRYVESVGVVQHRENQKRAKLKRLYNMTLEEWNLRWQQQEGKCAICRRDINGLTVRVDHDHRTGDVRGLLCSPCNQALGLMKEDMMTLLRAADYLRWSGFEREVEAA